MRQLKTPRLTEDLAEALALQVLSFLVSDPKRISRFFALTGITPDDLRRVASSRELQAAILDYLLMDEGLLLVFCQETGVEPAIIAPAHRLLAGYSDF